MKTRERILATALDLFNKKGTDIITTRHIATEMTISHGNLCYHFPRKEEIIKALYQNLVLELDEEFKKMSEQEINIRFLVQSVYATFFIQLKYKFILIEMVKIMRSIPEIGDHFKRLFNKRMQQLEAIVNSLIRSDYFKEELFPGYYKDMIKQFYLIADFWISEAEILYTGKEEEKLNYYHRLCINFFIPHLTEKGLTEHRLIK